MYAFVKRWTFLIILLIALGLFFYFDLQRFFSFNALKQHREFLITWTNQHYWLAVSIFILAYTFAVAISFPGATFFTLVSGFLFGVIWGTIYVVISATLGALGIFLAVKLALEPFMRKKTSKWIDKMRAGFQRNALQYLLILRLIPLFPFWVVNIASALLGVNTSIFIIATFFGIIPGSIVYVLIGNGLGHVLDQNKMPDLYIIFQPQILIPLILLALLTCLPSFYKYRKGKLL